MSVWTARKRGQPLAAIAVLLAVWIGGRAMMWESPFPLPQAVAEALPRLVHANLPGEATPFAALVQQGGSPDSSVRPLPAELAEVSPSLQAPYATAAWPREAREHARIMAGHQMLWLAATSALPLPPEVASLFSGASVERAAALQAAPTIVPPWPGSERAPSRWSLDAWALYRPGSSVGGSAPAGTTSYGASQAGAVMRYRLAGRERAPAVYLRGSRAFGSQRDTEVAVGLSGFPLAALPVSAQAEVRATRAAGRTRLRPAAFAVTHLRPQALPLGMRGEVYVQAGYVAGRDATAFVDGQARVDRPIARFDLGELRAGAGAWGGAQKGAARLDLGPSMALDLRVEDVAARVALDYRVRVAGDAAPDSGVALTLSTGF